ncbi:MAG: copper resistance protein CopA [Gammaproteobacteria bacterium]|mgnify:CR=1 FL=1|nr:copper resistance protein CopA [Gammaproteobacteria bacterium]|tara:strand:+ start:10380 stop:12164 length:1785 start_codon:yes stop_codon:yes gene_type:complete
MDHKPDPTRRRLLQALAASGLITGLSPVLPNYAASAAVNRGNVPAGKARDVTMDIAIRRETIDIAGDRASATTINHSIPGPLIELWEGRQAVLRVTNHLDEDSSIHWHGILLPFEMDGVPGVTFPGIRPGDTFEANFNVRQYGTYWYHSHSGLQEQTGVYGPLIVHPKDPEPFAYDRDYVIVLSDWTFEDPKRVMAKLKKMSDYYNFNRRTVGEFFDDVEKSGLQATLRDRIAWGNMRMSPTDIADVTGHTYTYLMNGLHPASNWTGLFKPGERVRLRIINASAMSFFNVRIPGLPMTVVLADGQYVEPVETDEFQIGVAERYDVIVEPQNDQAYTVMAESMDRSGYARGTLAPRQGMIAAVPPLREPPVRTMVDMGMDMDGMDMGGTDMGGMEHGNHDGGMQMAGGDDMMPSAGPIVARHGPDWHGPGNISVAEVQRNRLGEPGTGLENVGHRVLTYAQLRNVLPMQDTREPTHTVELHLTGNMERYMWSFDGKEFHEVSGPIDFPYGERVRLIMVNDTMMEHPIHLHGMFMELENGQGDRLPFKDTIALKPSERVSLLITAVEPGRWAFHCHLLYHMEMGMFRVVRIRNGEA